MPADRPNFAARRFFTALCAVFILVVVIGVPVAVLAPVPAAHASVVADKQRTLPPAAVRFPSFGHWAVGVDGIGDAPLAEGGTQQPRPIASITKVVTALVVLEQRPLQGADEGPTIKYTGRDVDILNQVLDDGGSYAPVQAGWKLTERQSITTMMLPSANNYAESLAIWAYGSVPKYLVAARAFLAANGLTHTKLVDTNGLSDSDVSTPSDLVRLGEIALAQPVVASIVSEQSVTEPQIGELDNTNGLLGSHGIDGIKTGTASNTDANLLFSAHVTIGTKKVRIVGVVLGALNHDQIDGAVPGVLKTVEAGLHDVPLASGGQSFGTYHTEWGTTARAVAAKGASMLVWSTAKVVRVADVQAIRGGTKGELVGSVTYSVGSAKAVVPLVLDRNVLAAPMWWRLTHPVR